MEIANKAEIWFAVLNVYAASKRAESYWHKAEMKLHQIGVVFHGNRTGRSGNAMEITFDACMAGYRKFIAVGGDGTVHDVLNGIAAYLDWVEDAGRSMCFSDFTLSVIPVGSGNDWIKSTGVPKDVCAAAEILAAGHVGRQDVVKMSVLDENDNEISCSYMVNVGGVGLDPRICEQVNRLKAQGKRGRILYLTSLVHAIRHRKSSRIRVMCDGEIVFNGPFYSIAFGIGKYSGGGMRQTPTAVLDDGLVDITVIPELPMKRILREVWRLFDGTFHKVPELVTGKYKEVVVCPEGSVLEPIEVDGEVVGRGKARFQVVDSQINIVLPDC